MSAPQPAQAALSDQITAYQPGQWFDARTIDEMQAFYLSRLPAIREAAKEHGYAIGVHGSQRRDFDLMAMQWSADASDKDSLARAIADAACGIRREGAYDWEQKPSGRVATSIPICWTAHDNPDFDNMISAGHIDLSIILAASHQPAAAPVQAVVVPEGYVLMPFEPTDAMWKAASEKYNGTTGFYNGIYKAMLAAAPAAPSQAPVQAAVVYPPDGTVSPFTVINLGSGMVKMGDAVHDDRLPALWFGKNGLGMGVEEAMNRVADDGETLAVVTFANVESLDVLLEVVQRIRKVKFPAAPSPAPVQPADAAPVEAVTDTDILMLYAVAGEMRRNESPRCASDLMNLAKRLEVMKNTAQAAAPVQAAVVPDEYLAAVDAVCAIYSPLSCSMKIGSDRRVAWERLFDARSNYRGMLAAAPSQAQAMPVGDYAADIRSIHDVLDGLGIPRLGNSGEARSLANRVTLALVSQPPQAQQVADADKRDSVRLDFIEKHSGHLKTARGKCFKLGEYDVAGTCSNLREAIDAAIAAIEQANKREGTTK